LPVRAFPKERILQLAAAAKPYSDRAGLVSIALCDHPDIEEILTRLTEMGYSISPASLRLDDLTPTDSQACCAPAASAPVTIAPEVGSDRFAGGEQDRAPTTRSSRHRDDLRGGMENLKLYYMIGIPTETDDDLVAIRDQSLQMRDIMMRTPRVRGHVGRIVGSVNPLVPKPAPRTSGCRWRTTRRSTARSSGCAASRPTSRTSTSTSSPSGSSVLPGAAVAR
jgi:radical SAM superfamily enzyme YgiQ (UPF0313 family)